MEEQTEAAPEPQVPLRTVLKDLGLSNAEIKQAGATGKVLVRGVPTADAGRMVHLDEVQYVPDARKITPGRDVVILHRDYNVAVVNKPSGWLSVKANNQKNKSDIVSFIGKVCDESFAVHRLDQETSGVMMVALDEDSQYRIKELFEVHDVERRYLAIVQGRPGRDKWRVESMLVRNRGDGKRGTGDSDDGKRAVTHFKVLEKLRGATLVEATLETGRTHQVRIHLAEAGHPVLGDKIYGNAGSSRRFPRVALHAAVLGFDHPSSQLKMRFDVPLADDMEKLRRELTRPEYNGAHLEQGSENSPASINRRPARNPKKKKKPKNSRKKR